MVLASSRQGLRSLVKGIGPKGFLSIDELTGVLCVNPEKTVCKEIFNKMMVSGIVMWKVMQLLSNCNCNCNKPSSPVNLPNCNRFLYCSFRFLLVLLGCQPKSRVAQGVSVDNFQGHYFWNSTPFKI